MDYDVIVVGAGFAGATAARECATRGLRTLVLEGRDRLGGRTWTSQFSDGEMIEIGGTYVHWFQPHTWSEISRYGLVEDVVEAAVEPEWALVPAGPALKWRPFAEFSEWEKGLLERVFEPSRSVLQRPFTPLSASEEVAEFDAMTVRDRLDQLDLCEDEDAYLSGLFATEASSSPDTASFLSLMRWWAPGGHTYEGMEETIFAYKLANGTISLLNAIIGDGGAEVRLETPVRRVDSRDTHVVITTADGETITAGAAVVATPAGIWPRLEFVPALQAKRLEAACEGMQVARGAKIVAILRGESRRIYIQPRLGHPIGFMWTSHMRSDDEQVVVIFCSPTMKDAENRDEVTAALQDLLPGVEVVELVAGTYLEGDEFANGGWPFPKLGQLMKFAPHINFACPEGRVTFATSDIATGWCGFIDGAIETGVQAARQVREILAADIQVPGRGLAP